jgi:hypothetical protein
MADLDLKSMSYEELVKLADDIEHGRDKIPVSPEMIDDPREKPSLQERQSLQQKIQNMPAGERLKLAMKGNREARVILIRDSSLMIRRYVLLNPRITDDEVLTVVRNRQVDRELLEMVWRNDEWLNNYQIKLALVKHPKTPAPIALRHISGLLMRDLRFMAKSKNIPSAVNSAAKRIVLRGSLR